MGLLSWLFPSPEQRLVAARKLLADGRAADARLEAMALDLPGAREIVSEAERQLAHKNIEAALTWMDNGDDEKSAEHLELAEQFGGAALATELRAARAKIREIKASRAVEEERKRIDRQARLTSADPLGISGGPNLLVPPPPEDFAGEDQEELRARLDLLVANYPERLRQRVAELGLPFGQAVLDLDDGRADLALQGLLTLPDEHPLVCWERARAEYALEDTPSAVASLRRFADVAGGHHPIGQHHSGVFLAQLLAESGDVDGALRVLRDVRAREPQTGGFLFAQLLAAKKDYAEAEGVLRALIQNSRQFLPAYALLAEVRLRGGHRVEAMAALERAMDQTCSTGRCGTCAPDLGITRALATLYLEDGMEKERALQLAQDARQMVQQPTWDDLYLAALTARATGAPDADTLLARAHELAPEPRRERVTRYLPAPQDA